jgi:uncharacterized iron-regulated membrane protein
MLFAAILLCRLGATGYTREVFYLGFPQQGRDLLSSVAPMTPQQRGGFAAPLMQRTELNVDRAVEVATAASPGSRLAAVFVPTQQSGAWRVQLREGQSEGVTTVMVEDRTGSARRVEPLSGDRAALWIRWIHEGSHSGALWQVLVFVCGILPTLFTVTGALIWLRSRKAKRSLAPNIGVVPQVDPAE